ANDGNGHDHADRAHDFQANVAPAGLGSSAEIELGFGQGIATTSAVDSKIFLPWSELHPRNFNPKNAHLGGPNVGTKNCVSLAGNVSRNSPSAQGRISRGAVNRQ